MISLWRKSSLYGEGVKRNIKKREGRGVEEGKEIKALYIRY